MSDTIETINPATGELEYSGEADGEQEVARKVSFADQCFSAWRTTSMAQRAEVLLRVASTLEELRAELAETMAREMGKPVTQGRAEIDKCAWVCRYFAEKAEEFLAPREIETDKGRSYVSYQPLGVILAVMPWNFPFWQVFRFAAPNLMAGNVALLKHASNVPQCALAIEKIFLAAGAPAHLFQTLLIPASAVGSLVRTPAVRAVTLTGSTEAGRSVAETAGAALKKTVLLLGGTLPGNATKPTVRGARRGAYYPPTVLTAVGPGMPSYEDGLFGPVAAIVPAVCKLQERPTAMGRKLHDRDAVPIGSGGRESRKQAVSTTSPVRWHATSLVIGCHGGENESRAETERPQGVRGAHEREP